MTQTDTRRTTPLPAPPADRLPDDIVQAAQALARGDPILVFDKEGREEETDILIAAEHCTPDRVHQLRRDGGGLVFLAVDGVAGQALGLPFAHDMMEVAKERFPLLDKVVASDIPYDARSSFSLWVNHRDTFTGITDKDRSLTIRAVAQTAADVLALPEDTRAAKGPDLFGERFRAPGHVSLCVGHRDGLLGRHGHTELATALARIGGCTPVVAGCEMLDGETGGARTKSDAEKYAREHGLPFLDGARLIEAYDAWKKDGDRTA